MPFDKHEQFITRADDPFNGGAPPALLRRSLVTPADQFFVRSHAPVPVIASKSYRLNVCGQEFSLDDLQSKFATHRVTATLACAGNRRLELAAIQNVTGEVPWGPEAISNATWEGALLHDVLRGAGNDATRARHVEFIGLDQIHEQEKTFGFGGSIPIEKALAGDVLVAWGMNGQPLPPAHGFPLRVVVPGYIGARSVKWVARINALDRASENFFQARAYKLFAPQVREETADWAAAEPLGELSVNSVITSPTPGTTLRVGKVTIEGYAITGGNRAIERVEFSIDDGRTWAEAALTGDSQPGAWRFWEARVELAAGKHVIVARAFDFSGNSQPRDLRAIWNFRGYMNNAWHRVEVGVENVKT